jgi:Cu(I)/Ag(I) efflux system membrane fusion protein
MRNEDWNRLRESLIGQLRNWQAAPGLEQQRTNLFKLSDALRAGLSSFGGGQVTYVQFCPMAFDNTGARWLSNSATIENPYLPETMLGCGEVISRL